MVIGELILDEYIFTEYLGAASKEEIAVMNYKNNKTYFGGAFPIAKNVSEFCNNTTFLSCGKVSKEVLNNLRKKNRVNNLKINFVEDEYRVIKKTRFLSTKNKKLFEIYYQSSENKQQKNKKIFNYLNQNLAKFDLVIVADFGHGFLMKK